MAGSGLTMPSSPETTMSLNRFRMPNRSRAMANMSAAQFVRAMVFVPAWFSSARTAPVPGTSCVIVCGKCWR